MKNSFARRSRLLMLAAMAVVGYNLDAQTITGSGTTSYVPRFTGAATIGNSHIYDDGFVVVIGGTSPISGEYFSIQNNHSGPTLQRIFNNSTGTLAYTGYMASSSASSTSIYQFGSSYSGSGMFGANIGSLSYNGTTGMTIGNTASAPLSFWTTNAQRMTITSGGNIGIGTTTPGALLEISNGSSFKIYANASGDIASSTNFRPHFASGDFSVFEGTPGTGTLRFKITGGTGLINIPNLQGSSTRTLLVDAYGTIIPGTPMSPTSAPWLIGGNNNGSEQTIGTLDAFDLPFVVANNEKLRIKQNGNMWLKPCNFVVGSAGGVGLNYGTVYLGLNTQRDPSTGTWTTYSDNLNNGAGVIWGGIGTGGEISFSPIPSTNGSTNGSYTDANVLANKTMSIRWNPNNTGTFKGQVVIGNQSVVAGPHANALLTVSGKIVCQEVRVFLNTTGTYWADYVFKTGYKLMPLSELEKFYTKNHHLPGVPTEKEIQEEGNDLPKTDAILLSKVEENTLYIVELNKKLEQLQKENEELKNAIKSIIKQN